MTEKSWLSELEKLFLEAGFTDSCQLMSDICHIPENTLVLHNSYALIVGCEIMPERDRTRDNLIQTKDNKQDFIREALQKLENKKGLIIDGYLLIVLKQAPDNSIKEVAQEIELDTKVCRKHIVWPLADNTELDRTQFVTVISLPEPLQIDGSNTIHFELSAEARELLSEYNRQGNLDGLMNAIKSGAIGNASRPA